MATGDGSRLLFAGHAVAGSYAYRNGMSMIPAEEFVMFFDDFLAPVSSNTPNGWNSSVVDAGGSITTTTTAAIGATGVLTITSDDASEGGSFWGAKSVQLTAGKRFVMEAKLRCDDVTDNAIQFGVAALTATANPEDLWTTVQTDLIAFGILDGGGTTKLLADKSNSGSTVETGSRSMVVNTWHLLAIEYTGLGLRTYVDGKLSNTWSQAVTTIPTGVALAPFIGALNGNGAGGNLNYVDYVRGMVER